MATLLKQSTAVNIKLGPFVDEEDGVTPLTSLTISQADVRLAKNDGNWAQKSASGNASHEENGWYEISLSATDTNTLGTLIVAVNKSGALPVWREFQVVPANVYDSLVAGSDNLQVDAVQAAGTAWGSGAITANSIASNAITADKIATDAVTEIQSGLATASDLSTVDGVVDAIKAVTDNLPDSGALTSLATASALATVDGNVDAILEDTGTTLPSTLSTISDKIDTVDGVADGIKAVTDNLPDSGALTSIAQQSDLEALDAKADEILEDTGTTLPGTLSGIDGKIDTVDGVADAIKAVTDNLPESGTLSSLATASALATVDGIVDDILARLPDEVDGYTFPEVVTLISAVLLGKASGLDTTTAVFRSLDDAKDRITATVDNDGNRAAVTLDAS